MKVSLIAVGLFVGALLLPSHAVAGITCISIAAFAVQHAGARA